jgi:large subunit ribosomal protein L18
VFRSNRYTYVQAIDDAAGTTLVAASNREKELVSIRNTVSDLGKLGEAFGKRLAAKKISTVVFDRNGYLYHGRVKAVADGMRKSGIEL